MIRATLGSPIKDEVEILVDGEHVDPAELTLRYRLARDGAGDSEVVVIAADPLSPPAPIERQDVGRYRAFIDLPEVGNWRVRWESASPKAASETEVLVRTIYPGLE